MLAGRLAQMKPTISGRRIRSCIAIHAPKENPATQQPVLLGLWPCIQSSAAAASRNSPWPWSNTPCEQPTPRKLAAPGSRAARTCGTARRRSGCSWSRRAAVRVQDHRQRRRGPLAVDVTSLEPPIRTVEDHLGHLVLLRALARGIPVSPGRCVDRARAHILDRALALSLKARLHRRSRTWFGGKLDSAGTRAAAPITGKGRCSGGLREDIEAVFRRDPPPARGWRSCSATPASTRSCSTASRTGSGCAAGCCRALRLAGWPVHDQDRDPPRG